MCLLLATRRRAAAVAAVAAVAGAFLLGTLDKMKFHSLRVSGFTCRSSSNQNGLKVAREVSGVRYGCALGGELGQGV